MRVQLKTTATICVLALSTFAASSAWASNVVHFEGFEDAGWLAGQPGNWQNYAGATITRVATGTAGIDSSSGSAHGQLTPGGGPYTFFGGSSTNFNGGFTASLDVYLDPANWSDGDGFDYSVAAYRQTGIHLRDFIFHVGVVENELLVNGSNNTDGVYNEYKLLNNNGGNYYTVANAGWYTFQHDFYDAGDGSLAVDLNLFDDGGLLLYTVTRNTTDDVIATIVGGNGYGWFTYNNIDGLAIDNTQLSQTAVVPLPAAVWAGMVMLGGMGGVRAWKRRRAAA